MPFRRPVPFGAPPEPEVSGVDPSGAKIGGNILPGDQPELPGTFPQVEPQPGRTPLGGGGGFPPFPGDPRTGRGSETPRERSQATPGRPMFPASMAGSVSAGPAIGGGGGAFGGIMGGVRRRLLGRAGGLQEGGLGVPGAPSPADSDISALIQAIVSRYRGQ